MFSTWLPLCHFTGELRLALSFQHLQNHSVTLPYRVNGNAEIAIGSWPAHVAEILDSELLYRDTAKIIGSFDLWGADSVQGRVIVDEIAFGDGFSEATSRDTGTVVAVQDNRSVRKCGTIGQAHEKGVQLSQQAGHLLEIGAVVSGAGVIQLHV